MQKRFFWFFILVLSVSVYTDNCAIGRRNKRSRNKEQMSTDIVDTNFVQQDAPILYRPTIKNNPLVVANETTSQNVEVDQEASQPTDGVEETHTRDQEDTSLSENEIDQPAGENFNDTNQIEQNENSTTTDEMAEQDAENDASEEIDDLIEFQFENVDMLNLIKQIEDIFAVSFIMDDSIDPLVKGGRLVKGNKITYKTNIPLSRKEAWNLFLNFLQIAGFSVVKTAHNRVYRITQIETARKLPLPLYIGTDYRELPDSDELVRFVYFVENSPIESIKVMVDALRSSSSSLIILQDQKAFLLTDRAYNIKILMEIIKNLDKVSAPQTVSVLKLRQADARQVKELYDSIAQSDDKGAAAKSAARKQPTTIFFPENMRIIAEPRTNSLILLGPQDAITKVENFIKKHIDKEIDQTYSPLYVYQLQYADANTIAEIMNNVTQFGKDTEAGKNGGVRGVDQYMQPMSFVPEKETNRIIIKGYYEDYLKAIDVIKKLDEPQPQIAIEILLLSVSINDVKSLGAQIRSKDTNNGLLGNNVKFQTSGLFGSSTVAQNTDTTTGAQRLLGNLLQVVKNASPGNTILQLGSDLFGVWGVLQVLETITNTQVISNPFLIATNKTPSVVELGEERRVRTAQVVGTNTVDSFGKDDANLEINITPQINSDGMIVLDLRIVFDNFINAVNTVGENNATKNVREIKTSTTVSNNEILAIGGLIRNRIVDNMSKVPVLGDIPVLGWLFKNKRKSKIKENLLILISVKIIDPDSDDAFSFTQNHLGDFRSTINSMTSSSDKHDPIHKIFFDESKKENDSLAENVLFDRHQKNKSRQRARKRKQQQNQEQEIVTSLEAQQAIVSSDTFEQQSSTSQSTPHHKSFVTQPINTPIQSVIKDSESIDNHRESIATQPTPTKVPTQTNAVDMPQVVEKSNDVAVNTAPAYRPRIMHIAQKERKPLSLSQFLSHDSTRECL